MKIAVFIAFICSIGLCFGQDTLLKAPTIEIKPKKAVLVEDWHHGCMCGRETEFPGGTDSLHQYLQSNLDLSGIDGLHEIQQGKIYVVFIVNELGGIENPTFYNLLDPRIQSEIERVLYSMPNWIPAENSCNPSRIRICIPIVLNSGDARYRIR